MADALYGVKVINGVQPEKGLDKKMTLEEIGDNFPELVEVVRVDGFLIVTATVGLETVTISSPEIAGRYIGLVNVLQEDHFEWQK